MGHLGEARAAAAACAKVNGGNWQQEHQQSRAGVSSYLGERLNKNEKKVLSLSLSPLFVCH